MAQTILISSNQVKLLANDLLDQQVIKKGRFVPDYYYGSILEAINEIVKQVRLTLVRKNIRIRTNCSFTRHILTRLHFDRRRLQQVLLNLLLNAVKFQQQGKIQVDAQVVSEDIGTNKFSLEISVLDQGIGMTAEEASHVFDTFEGRGIGLSICKQICMSLGGNISVTSRPNGGSRFIFTMQVFQDAR
jgi:signal transduction histidine kinase